MIRKKWVSPLSFHQESVLSTCRPCFQASWKDSGETEYRNKQLYCPRLRAISVSQPRLPASKTNLVQSSFNKNVSDLIWGVLFGFAWIEARDREFWQKKCVMSFMIFFFFKFLAAHFNPSTGLIMQMKICNL